MQNTIIVVHYDISTIFVTAPMRTYSAPMKSCLQVLLSFFMSLVLLGHNTTTSMQLKAIKLRIVMHVDVNDDIFASVTAKIIMV